MNDVIRTIKERRSVRAYSQEQITDEQLKTILEAGEYAASGMGEQATMMVAVQNPEIIAQLSGLNASVLGADTDPFYGAPTVVVVFADSDRITAVEDGSIVIDNMMLAAASIGVDSCWIHRAKEVFDMEEGKAFKKQWNVPESYVGVGHCILGYAEGEKPAAAQRKQGRVVRV